MLREPGSTQVGEQIRKILLDPQTGELSSVSELMLYEAARAQVVEQVITPALNDGKVVLCDRFSDSTIAYQGYGRQLGESIIKTVDQFACNGLVPDRTLLLVRDMSTALSAARNLNGGSDRIEGESDEFHQRVAKGFETIAAANPQRVRVVQVPDGIDIAEQLVFEQVSDLFLQDGMQ